MKVILIRKKVINIVLKSEIDQLFKDKFFFFCKWTTYWRTKFLSL